MMYAAVFLVGALTGIVSLMVASCLITDSNSYKKSKKLHENYKSGNNWNH